MANARNYEEVEDELILDNETGKTHLARNVAAIKMMAETMNSGLKRDLSTINDVSSLYQSNQTLVEKTTKQITDILSSPASRTCCYLFVAILMLMFILFLLG